MKKKTVVTIHFLYWFYIINQSLFPLYVGKLQEANVMGNQYLREVAISLFLNVLSFYAVYFAFPAIASIRRKIAMIPAVVGLLLLIMGARLPVDWLFWKLAGSTTGQMTFQWVWVWNELRLVIITGIYAVLIRFMIHAFETQKLRDELIRQRQAGELALLKSQVNPHFLFNTLNNIYSLVYQKSEEAPEAVMKFSSIMRYVLYDATAEKVPLEKEIEYLKSYVELQKLRIRQQDFVVLNIGGETTGVTIPPVLLIPVVENAFKHGSKNHSPGIIIYLNSGNQQIRFEVTNYVRKNQPVNEKEFSGTGLNNIRRRLDLTHPGKYSLQVTEDDEQFKVTLLLEP